MVLNKKKRENSRFFLFELSCGEGGIRTHGTQDVHTISSRADSTALAPLRFAFTLFE